MNSQNVTDDDGQRLRGTYFPFHVDRTPPPSAGFGTNSKRLVKSMSKGASTGLLLTLKSPKPSTLMIVDYNQDRQQIHGSLRHNENNSMPLVRDSALLLREGLTIQPVKTQLFSPTTSTTITTNNNKHNPIHNQTTKKSMAVSRLTLRSSFLMPQKVDTTRSELENCISQQLFNKEDASCQTENELIRHDFPSLTEYNQWSNAVAEPFFKVNCDCM
jgi:hypothetical protein